MEAKILKTPDYLRVLETEKLITFSTTVEGHESHHQISILEYDTREKIEKRMAEVLIQVSEELQRTKSLSRKAPVPADIQQLVDEHPLP